MISEFLNLISGVFDLPWWGYVVVTLVYTHITIACITIYLHRHSAHRALELHAIPSHFFRFWLWMTSGMVTKEWTAIHRKHHAKCETVDDPHSPVIAGIGKVLLEGSELYRAEANPRRSRIVLLYSALFSRGIVTCPASFTLLQSILFSR